MLFNVSINYYNYKASDVFYYRHEISVFGRENACILAKKFIDADNVVSVDVIDALTGEVIESLNWKKLGRIHKILPSFYLFCLLTFVITHAIL